MRLTYIILLLYSSLFYAQNPVQLDSLLLKGIEARAQKEYANSLELLTKVRSIAQENEDYKLQFLAINNIGANYYSMLDYGEALDNYLDAYKIAIKYLDENEEMTVLNNIAILYSKEGDYTKAEEYFLKAYNLAKTHEQLINIGLYAVNLGIVTNQQNKIEEAATYLAEADSILKDDPKLSILVQTALVENYYKKNNLKTAQQLALLVLPHLNSIALNEERLSILIILSNIYNDLNNNAKAVTYAKEALAIAANPENRISAFNQLSKVYSQNGLFSEAISAKDSIIALTESLNKLKNGRLYENNRVKFELANYRRELDLSAAERERERKTFYVLLAVSVLIILLTSWALYNSYIKNKQRRILHKQNKEFIELELQKKKSDNLLLEKQLKAKEAMAQLEREKLKNEIEARNRKLASKAMKISARNDLIKEVINNLTNQTEIARNDFVSKKIKDLKKLLKNDSEWESFLTHFEEVNHGLLTKLRNKHPQLTANDIRYLSYLYMDLNTKEIASLFNITNEASRKRKERIGAKIDLPEGKSLYAYITSL